MTTQSNHDNKDLVMAALDKVNNIHENQMSKLCQDRDNLQRFLLEHSGTELGILAARLIDWPHLYSMFNTAFSAEMDSYGFLGNLYSFLVNTFLDDTYYYIEWRTTFLEEEIDGEPAFTIKTDRDGHLVTYLSTRDNSLSRPYVYLSGDGSKSVSGMMEAMDEYERRDKARLAELDWPSE